ncbi:MAG TPA: hypothetical protein VHX65_01060 [Pirellulales bacterium]|jgi:hypothetical protein|nr:hypothetical protein [Pirellulales bacterium]
MISYTIIKKRKKMAKAKQHGGKREGAGRKVTNPDGPAVVLAASVPSGLVEALDAYRKCEQCSRSEAVTRAIRALVGKRKRAATG